MTRVTTTVTHPDGTVSKRTSATRQYEYAIQVGPENPTVVAAICERHAREQDAKIARIQVALLDPKVVLRDRRLGGVARYGVDTGYDGQPVYHQYEATLVGTDTSTWANSKGETRTLGDDGKWVVVDALEHLIGVAHRRVTHYGETAANFREYADNLRENGAEALRGNAGRWGVARWSSRYDLANKALTEFAFHAARGCDVSVVPVDTVPNLTKAARARTK